MMPANQPAWMLLNDQVAMNCGSRAGTSEKPARPRISARQTQATRRVSAFIYRVYRTDVDHRCVPSDGEAVVAAWAASSALYRSQIERFDAAADLFCKFQWPRSTPCGHALRWRIFLVGASRGLTPPGLGGVLGGWVIAGSNRCWRSGKLYADEPLSEGNRERTRAIIRLRKSERIVRVPVATK